jgi:hypothetical protein
MKEPEPIEQKQVEEDFGIEITDLDQPYMTGSGISSWVASRLLAWQRPEYWRRFRLVSLFCIPLIFVLVLLLSIGNSLSFLIAKTFRSDFELNQTVRPQSNSYFIPGVVPITRYHVHQQDGLACLVDAQWSPDSSLIAVLGYQRDCPGVNGVPGILNIYNAHSGKLVAQWQTDDTILSILNPSPISPRIAVSSFGAATPKSVNEGENKGIDFNYSRVLWSPGGQRLAITFSTIMQQQPLPALLLMDVDGEHIELMLQPQNNANELPIEWDLGSGMAVPFKPVPPALRYRWGTNGTLIPEMLLSYETMLYIRTPGRVGSPEGENSFTIWQPGYTALTNISGLSVWSTNFGAWSPDGRYLIDGMSQAGLMEPQGHPLPDAQALEQMRMASMPLLPAHDAALLQVALTTSVVAWRPDGRILAAFNYYDAVNLYDCVTGRKIASLPLSFRNEPLAGSAALLRWSPDGSRLLLSSAQGGAITLWGPVQLPQ